MAHVPRVIITGAAGFIGMHLVKLLVSRGFEVIGLDNFKPSYSDELSRMRGESLLLHHEFEIVNIDLSNEINLPKLVKLFDGSHTVIHLAAWPGVRLGQVNPFQYLQNNVRAFSNILEAVKITKPNKFMFASSSSIYGDLGRNGPVREEDATGLNLRSLYAGTKWTNEILASKYFEMTEVPTIALRFFTVFGEYGRPDMAYWSFLEKLIDGTTIDLYGENGGIRNFTYVKDCVEILHKLLELEVSGFVPLNIAVDSPIQTLDFLNYLAHAVDKEPIIRVVKRPVADVSTTWADQSKLLSMIGKTSSTPITDAIENFVSWYFEFKGI